MCEVKSLVNQINKYYMIQKMYWLFMPNNIYINVFIIEYYTTIIDVTYLNTYFCQQIQINLFYSSAISMYAGWICDRHSKKITSIATNFNT